jgi:hypothetical protein
MNLIRRIDMFMTKRRADAAIKKYQLHYRRILDEQKRISRPHVQSAHMISWPIEREYEPEWGVGRVWIICAVLMFVLWVCVNVQEPVAMVCSMQK